MQEKIEFEFENGSYNNQQNFKILRDLNLDKDTAADIISKISLATKQTTSVWLFIYVSAFIVVIAACFLLFDDVRIGITFIVILLLVALFVAYVYFKSFAANRSVIDNLLDDSLNQVQRKYCFYCTTLCYIVGDLIDSSIYIRVKDKVKDNQNHRFKMIKNLKEISIEYKKIQEVEKTNNTNVDIKDMESDDDSCIALIKLEESIPENTPKLEKAIYLYKYKQYKGDRGAFLVPDGTKHLLLDIESKTIEKFNEDHEKFSIENTWSVTGWIILAAFGMIILTIFLALFVFNNLVSDETKTDIVTGGSEEVSKTPSEHIVPFAVGLIIPLFLFLLALYFILKNNEDKFKKFIQENNKKNYQETGYFVHYTNDRICYVIKAVSKTEEKLNYDFLYVYFRKMINN